LGANLSSSIANSIEIIGSNVTLDLNGFTVSQFAPTCTPSFSAPFGNSCTGSGGSGFGIYSSGTSVTVKNGAVNNVNGTCISLGGDGSVIENVTVRSCAGDGIDLNGIGKNLTAEANLFSGIVLNSGSLDSSTAANNNTDGIELLSTPGLLQNSTANYNKSHGVYDISSAQINNVTASQNGTGIDVEGHGHVFNSTASSNTNAGVNFTAAGDVSNTASFNNGTYGFNLSASTCYLNVTTSGNASGSINGGTTFSSGVCAH